jgi:sugar/nucleoside kinase (ribokinase family)
VARHDVITVGDLMIDVRVEEDALAGGHVAGKVHLGPGGSAATAAAWARAAGATAAVVGRVGNDFPGRALRRALEEHGIEPLLAVDSEAPTGSVLTLGRTLVAERGANARLAPADLPGRLSAGAVLVSGYILLHEDTEAAAIAALERADASWLAVDAASARLLRSYGRERFFAATERASALLLNEDAAFELTDETPESAVLALSAFYRLVCVTQGADGAVAVLEGERVDADAPALEIGDPTGAGDAFAGTLLAGLVQRRPLGDALREACRSGAESATAAEAWPPGLR